MQFVITHALSDSFLVPFDINGEPIVARNSYEVAPTSHITGELQMIYYPDSTGQKIQRFGHATVYVVDPERYQCGMDQRDIVTRYFWSHIRWPYYSLLGDTSYSRVRTSGDRITRIMPETNFDNRMPHVVSIPSQPSALHESEKTIRLRGCLEDISPAKSTQRGSCSIW